MSSRKTALVTGAAARIGAAIAMTLHERGCDVLLHYNSNEEGARDLAARLNEIRAGSAAVAQADLSQPAGVESLAEAQRSVFGRLDILVHNASRFYPTAVGETLAWQWEDLLDSNLRGPYFLTQALLPELKTAGGVVIVDWIVGIFRHFLVKIDGVGLETNHGLVGAEIRHLGSRMPGGARGQFVPFDHDAVGDAFLC